MLTVQPQTRGMALGDLISSLAESKDMTNEMSGKAAGISGSTVSQIKSGSIDCPPMERLEGIAKALGVATSRLVSAAERDGCSYERSATIMTSLPTVGLVRMNEEVNARAVLGEDGNTMIGYPIVFNQWTEINSWEGKFRERIAPEAVNRTLKRRGDKIKALWNHDPNIILGKPSLMVPDEFGLRTEVPLSGTKYNIETLKPLLQDRAIDGMSFKFTVHDEIVERGEDGMEERTITDLTLYEFGPVTFAAYEGTIVGLRSEVPPELREAFKEFMASRSAQAPAIATNNDGPPSVPLSLEERNRHIREVETYLATGVLLTQETDNGRTTERDRLTTG